LFDNIPAHISPGYAPKPLLRVHDTGCNRIPLSYESLPGVTSAATFDSRTISMQTFEKQTTEKCIDRSRNSPSTVCIHWGK